MANRRSFLYKLGSVSAVAISAQMFQPAWSHSLQKALQDNAGTMPDVLASDEDFWATVQQAYTGAPGFINLNNGGVAPAPKPVADIMKANFDFSNQAPSYFMNRLLDSGREALRKRLATIAGCAAEELALVRNTTEAMEAVIFGINLKAGDEVVLCRQDYSSMINAWKQRARRDGIKLVWVDLNLPSEDDDYFVQQYAAAFTNNTKLVQVTHVINWNGQKLPVKKIAGAARKMNIEVMVDGAHSFAHVDFKISDLDCDYFGTSLHKWLSAPIGTGFLYVRKNKIGHVWPLFGSPGTDDNDIRKFEHQGTRPVYIEQAINEAISFHEMIGMARKEERLWFLKNYWMEKAANIPGVTLHTSLKKQYGGAIGLMNVHGKKPSELDAFLWSGYHIHTVPIVFDNISGLRITPNVYTTIVELDTLVSGIQKFVNG